MRKLARDRMTARQRVEATLAGAKPDRIPVFDLIQNLELIEFVTGERPTPANGLDLLCRTIGERLDITRGIAAPAEPLTFRDEDGFVYRQEWWTTWLVERPFTTVAGLKEHIRRQIGQLHERRPGDMWTFAGKANVWGSATQSPRERLRDLEEKTGGNTVIFPNESPVGLDTAYHRAGLELFCYAYAEDPELVSAWLEALNWAEIERVHESADAALSPVALVYSDIADKHQTLFSPQFLRREFFPRVRKLVDAWHAHGVKVIYHSDGNLWRVLDDLRACGIEGLNPLEPLAKMEAARVHAAYPNWVLMGGVDASRLLPMGSPEEVRQAARALIDEVGRAGKLWIGSSTEIHPAVPVENALALWSEVEEHGYLA